MKPAIGRVAPTVPAVCRGPWGDLMPSPLRKAYQALDRAVDRLYRCSGFASERERVGYLFGLYEKMRVPLKAGMRGKPRRQQRGKNSSPSAKRGANQRNQ